MPIYHLSGRDLVELDSTTFEGEGLWERRDLQARLKSNIEMIAPDTLVVAEEFGEWDSGRRIDLLGIDKDANLVVIELKRTQSGGHMELQAIRYAAMISSMTFNKLVAIYSDYLDRELADSSHTDGTGDNGTAADARVELLEFLECDDEPESFGQEVRIVLASADFSKELTTSVIWLNDNYGLGIRCVRMSPYKYGNGDQDEILLEVQQVIPLPEATEYQVAVQEKAQQKRRSRGRRILYDVTIGSEKSHQVPKNKMMYLIISALLRDASISNDKVQQVIPKIRDYNSETDFEQARRKFASAPIKRFFCDIDQGVLSEERYYLISSGWGLEASTIVDQIEEEFPTFEFEISPRP